MSRADRAPAIGLTTIPRAVLSMAHGMVSTVERAMVGDGRVRTSRGNAWEALCADRDRAARRAELRRMAADLARAQRPARGGPAADSVPATQATTPTPAPRGEAPGRPQRAPGRKAGVPAPSDQVTVGSSPRSRASQASLVGTGPSLRG